MGPLLMALPFIASGLGKLLNRGAQGAAQERTNRNASTQDTNRLAQQQYGTQQGALLQSLLNQDRGITDRYGTRQQATSNALANQSQEASSRYGTRQGATSHALDSQSSEGLARARLGIDSAEQRARQSILGSMMQNMRPVQISGGNARVMENMPQISGGLTPAMLDPLTRQHGGELMRAALQAQLTGSDVPGATNFQGGVLDSPEATDFRSGILQSPDMPDYSNALLKPPTMGGYQQAGRGESWMSGLGMGAGAIGEVLGGIINGGDYGGGFNPRNQDDNYVADAIRRPFMQRNG